MAWQERPDGCETTPARSSRRRTTSEPAGECGRPTQSSRGTYPTGEGFGLALAEAQLAGVPVVAPASGGSADAFVEGITGIRPTDGSARALAAAIMALLDDPVAYARMSARATVWSAHAFCPEQAIRVLRAALLRAGQPRMQVRRVS